MDCFGIKLEPFTILTSGYNYYSESNELSSPLSDFLLQGAGVYTQVEIPNDAASFIEGGIRSDLSYAQEEERSTRIEFRGLESVSALHKNDLYVFFKTDPYVLNFMSRVCV